MKLKKLKIQGFRSLKDVTWEPGDLNVLIGPNGGGKSNLLAALKFIQQSVTKGLRETTIAEGGWPGILYGSDEGRLGWSVEAKTDESEDGNGIFYTAALESQSNSGLLLRLEEHLEQRLFEANAEYFVDAINIISSDSASMHIEDDPQSIILDPTQLAFSVANWPGRYGTQVAFRNFLSSIEILTGYRTDGSSDVRRESLVTLDTTLSGDGSNLASVLHGQYTSDTQYRDYIDEAMFAAFGPEYERLEFTEGDDRHMHFGIKWQSFSKPIRSRYLSDGTLRFLLIVSSLLNPNLPPLIAIDEPEVGLHPGMMSVVAALLEMASYKTQVVVTTHSPELIGAFRDPIPTVTVVTSEDGQTQLRNVDREDLKRWISNFALGEMYVGGALTALAPSREKAA